MRTAFLFSFDYPPKSGGISMAAWDLARMFSSFGYRVVVFSNQWKGLLEESFHIENVIVETADHGAISSLRTWLAYFTEKIGRYHPDLMILNNYLPGAFRGEVYSRAVLHILQTCGVPKIYRSHGTVTSYHMLCWDFPPFFAVPTLLRAFLTTIRFEWVCRHYNACVYLSNMRGVFRNFDRLLASWIHPTNSLCIPNTFQSVKRSCTGAFKERYRIDGLFFLCVANFCVRKNQKRAISCMRKLKELRATFVFIGSQRNEYAVECERVAAGDSRFRFLYGIPRDEVIGAVNECDCAFLYSFLEQQPIAILEAMSCGKPWICSRTGSVEDFAGGIFVGVNNDREFAKAIKAMEDPALRKRLGGEGERVWARAFSALSVYEKWRKLLEKIQCGKQKGN